MKNEICKNCGFVEGRHSDKDSMYFDKRKSCEKFELQEVFPYNPKKTFGDYNQETGDIKCKEMGIIKTKKGCGIKIQDFFCGEMGELCPKCEPQKTDIDILHESQDTIINAMRKPQNHSQQGSISNNLLCAKPADNLSSTRRKVEYLPIMDKSTYYYLEEEVKEFIKRLKGILCGELEVRGRISGLDRIPQTQIYDTINKLAGDELAK